jgi:hypothetical protein
MSAYTETAFTIPVPIALSITARVATPPPPKARPAVAAFQVRRPAVAVPNVPAPAPTPAAPRKLAPRPPESPERKTRRAELRALMGYWWGKMFSGWAQSYNFPAARKHAYYRNLLHTENLCNCARKGRAQCTLWVVD